MKPEKDVKSEKMDNTTEEDELVDGTVKNKSIFQMLFLRGYELLTDPGTKWLVGDCTSEEEAVERIASLFRAFAESMKDRQKCQSST